MGSNSAMRILAKETAIYGLSSIVGKFLNWMLVPLYTYVLARQSDYGIVTNLYAWTALLLVILTYGMETGFFRFANKEGENAKTVFVTAMAALTTTSVLFALVCCVWAGEIAVWMGYEGHSEFIALLAVVVAMDAFASIPFAYLRYEKKAITFAVLKLLFVVLNIGFNLFFLVLCPKIADWGWIKGWWDADYGVGYVFVANILATGIQTICLVAVIGKALKKSKGEVAAIGAAGAVCASVDASVSVSDSAAATEEKEVWFSGELLGKMLRYSLPLLVLGVCGIMNQTLDRILFPFLYEGADAQAQLGIYGACFKVAMVMMMFTQAFRYAYEPFVFAKHKDRQSLEAYADAMKYYIVFSYLILLGMVFYLDGLKYIIAPMYWEGLKIVPVVLWAYIFQGVYFNLSFWYKLTDKTQFGAYFSLVGLVITAAIQCAFVPKMGYMASAMSGAVCYFVIMVLSYVVGRRYLAVPYEWKKIGLYTVLTIALLGVYYGICPVIGESIWLKWGVGTVLLAAYVGTMWRLDVKSLLRR